MHTQHQAAANAICKHALTAPSRQELNTKILQRIPSSTRFVLIGEASHGTREFYEQVSPLVRRPVT